MQIQILPSLLASDFGHLETGAKRAEAAGGDALHLDIMDAHFVPNLSMGPDVVAMARKAVAIPLSVHLMMTNPDRYIGRFAEAGADSILIHIESDCDVPATLRHIRGLGVRPGITLRPATLAREVFPVLDDVDEVLCMTVEPGYGGQAFMADMLPKIRRLRDRAASIGNPELTILVDGGIGVETAATCAAAGANAFIAGTALYGATDMAEELARMRAAAVTAYRGPSASTGT
jgi:ribulose-phosphate 3-epimerase